MNEGYNPNYNYAQPQVPQYYQQEAYAPQPVKSSKTFGTISVIFGILSCFGYIGIGVHWVIPVIGLCFSLFAAVFGILGFKEEDGKKISKVGLGIAFIGMILCIVALSTVLYNTYSAEGKYISKMNDYMDRTNQLFEDIENYADSFNSSMM